MRVPSIRDRDEVDLAMTPMIDVVFLLLVFFLWTSSFEQPEFDLPSALADPPLAASETARQSLAEPPEEFDEIVIRLRGSGDRPDVLLNEEPITAIADLDGKLRQIAALGVQPPVIVDPDDDVSMGMAIQIYDLARSIPFDRVLFVAKPE